MLQKNESNLYFHPKNNDVIEIIKILVEFNLFQAQDTIQP